MRLAILATVFAGTTLGGCHHQPAPSSSAPAAAQAGILVTGGRLVLPAVPGNPGAAYFTLVNQGHSAAILNSVVIDGAGQAEMHETAGNAMQPLPSLNIRGGGSAILAPGGKHVMVFALAPRLVAGTTTQVTLGFSDGSKLTAPLSIEAPGGAGGAGAMGGMKM